MGCARVLSGMQLLAGKSVLAAPAGAWLGVSSEVVLLEDLGVRKVQQVVASCRPRTLRKDRTHQLARPRFLSILRLPLQFLHDQDHL